MNLQHLVNNLMLDDWTEDEIGDALFVIDKPLAKITLADVRIAIESARNNTKPNISSLISLEQANKEARIRAQLTHDKHTGIACPHCGTELYDQSDTIMCSYPPLKTVACSGCGFKGTRVVA
jgi:predicted RNA-binding Zn-ribbon protein involved in translation (DUF1610 family)